MNKKQQLEKQVLKWKRIQNGGNLVLDYKKRNYYISYNTAANIINLPLGELWAPDNGSVEETALTNEKTNKWYVLNGDFRKEYEELYEKGFNACLEFYKSKKEKYGSSWSKE